ncbi:hypothetical protein BCR37DRAFT_380269 [Protomyces lactucae-debilis]|uniref:Uncharacterized protein n=1 Tax=Protomyces lactucae-debilis TaxID=2754530 RepID=A0A1Y2FD84_PROLT|nr:uncharacterized protein BCR37DRAFT_380269 [Protomyces lactucae-debilis]ORY81384.1 hypothetical protein BCR37DRAFT_380269 [Protomyces lactucae-debilis]
MSSDERTPASCCATCHTASCPVNCACQACCPRMRRCLLLAARTSQPQCCRPSLCALN